MRVTDCAVCQSIMTQKRKYKTKTKNQTKPKTTERLTCESTESFNSNLKENTVAKHIRLTAQPVGRKQGKITTKLIRHQLCGFTVAERPFLWLMCTADARYEGLQVSPRACELSHREVVISVLLQKATL